jgi:hypothetical protein
VEVATGTGRDDVGVGVVLHDVSLQRMPLTHQLRVGARPSGRHVGLRTAIGLSCRWTYVAPHDVSSLEGGFHSSVTHDRLCALRHPPPRAPGCLRLGRERLNSDRSGDSLPLPAAPPGSEAGQPVTPASLSVLLRKTLPWSDSRRACRYRFVSIPLSDRYISLTKRYHFKIEYYGE